MQMANARSWMVGGAVAVLAGCGGGDGAPAVTPMDKYVGSWSTCVQHSGVSGRATLAVTKTGPLTSDYLLTFEAHATTDCTGPVTGTDREAGQATLVGSKVLGTQAFDAVLLVTAAQTEKQVVAVVDGKLRTGLAADDGGPVDADGYPTTLDHRFVLSKA